MTGVAIIFTQLAFCNNNNNILNFFYFVLNKMFRQKKINIYDITIIALTDIGTTTLTKISGHTYIK